MTDIYTKTIDQAEDALKQKEMGFERELESQLLEATKKLKMKVGEEIRNYQQEIVGITKEKIPVDYMVKTFQLPTKLQEKVDGLNAEIMVHNISISAPERLFQNLHLVFGTKRHPLSDEMNRINALNGVEKYHGDPTTREYPAWEALEKHPWLKENKNLVMRLNSYGLTDLTRRKTTKETFVSSLKQASEDDNIEEGDRQKALRFIKEIEETYQAANPATKKSLIERVFPCLVSKKRGEELPAEHFYGQDFTNH